jgi:hypothetical protein
METSELIHRPPADVLSQRIPWLTAERRLIHVQDAEDRHAYCILRLIYNHAADVLGLPEISASNRYGAFVDVAARHPVAFAAYGALVGRSYLARPTVTGGAAHCARLMTEALEQVARRAALGGANE